MRRALVACAVLTAVYVALSFANDDRGSLGTDTGGKVATLRSMEQHRAFDPDVGYWAARWDPTGELHPLYYTFRVDDRWVNATTLPVLYAAYPLHRLGGYRLTLLLPMLGAVTAALAARTLARRLGSPGDLAFWGVGLLSPLALYALDFWEHSLGVALMAWAVVVLLDVPGHQRRWPRALVAGLLLGAAATIRTEALVYGVVATATVCVGLLWRERRLLAPLVVGAAVVAGLVLPLAGNAALEAATTGDTMRSSRASGAASAGGDTASLRLREGLVTTVGLQPHLSWGSAGLGAGALVLVAYALRRADAPGGRGPAAVAAAGAAGIYVARLAEGLGFIPGMTAAGPLTNAAAVGASDDGAVHRRGALVVALAALPVVWAFQFRGGAPAQWGGRYVLTSGLLLTVLGVVALERRSSAVRRALLGLSAAVTVFGLVWMSSRTHEVADSMAVLDGRPETVLVSRVAHLVREGGAYYRYGGRPWLTAVTDEQEAKAVDVVRRAGLPTFALIDPGGRAGAALRRVRSGRHIAGRVPRARPPDHLVPNGVVRRVALGAALVAGVLLRASYRLECLQRTETG